MRIKVGLVSENTVAFLNQVKLCLYSLRKNGGSLQNVPVTLLTNNEPLSEEDKAFFQNHFAPIEFKVMPRLGAIPHTSKLNVFYGIDPSSYDVLVYMDCDTVVIDALDEMLHPIVQGEAEFLCRRGGKTDREVFVDFNGLVTEFCRKKYRKKVQHETQFELPLFNSGVFCATAKAVRKIRSNSINFTYALYERWLQVHNRESVFPFTYLYKLKILPSKNEIKHDWSIEQGALALACIDSGVSVNYLPEVYNSWGQLDELKIVHCFKSAYTFNREKMFTNDSDKWLSQYAHSKIAGKRALARLLKQYKKDFSQSINRKTV